MDVSSIALSGLRAASQELRTAGTNIANANTPGFKAEEVQKTALGNGGVATDTVKTTKEVSLDEQVVDTQIATYNFQANLKVLQKQNEMEKSLLDIQA